MSHTVVFPDAVPPETPESPEKHKSNRIRAHNKKYRKNYCNECDDNVYTDEKDTLRRR